VTARLFLSPEIQEREVILHYNAMLEPHYPSLFDQSFLMVQRLAGSLDSSAVRYRIAAHMLRRYVTPLMAAAYRRGIPGGDRPAPILGLAHTQEQAPNPSSRVVLSQERDPLGLNRIALNWQTTDLDRRTALLGRTLLGQAFARAGLGQMSLRTGEDESDWPPKPLQGLRGHHMGTTRMHGDPRKGVVDEQCRVHGIGNLYVAGSSVFPTAGAGTPTITIIALAIRLADHLRAAN
jgi:choline dehydrogenase-like flavoprotein